MCNSNYIPCDEDDDDDDDDKDIIIIFDVNTITIFVPVT